MSQTRIFYTSWIAFTDRMVGVITSTLFHLYSLLSPSSSLSTFPADHLLLLEPTPAEQQQQPPKQELDVDGTNNETTTVSVGHTTTTSIGLPNWDYEISRLQLVLMAVSILWLIVLPYYCLQMIRSRSNSKNKKLPPQQQHSTSTVPLSEGTTTATVSRREPTAANRKHHIRYSSCMVVIRFMVMMLFLLVGWIISLVVLTTVLSPYNNSYTARRIYQTPLLTVNECQQIIEMSHVAASTNVRQYERYHPDDLSHQEVLMMDTEPYGWQKLRHRTVPTTDLNLVTDPFTYENQQSIRHLCNVRMAPLLSRLYGVPIRSIQARDIFVVRYDGNMTLRHKLKKHTDGGDISFTIYLNTDFTGGGTRFWNRHTKEPFHLLQPNVAGLASIFNSIIEHEGYPTTQGQRYILVGFVDIVPYITDVVDGMASSTGLSWYASWFNWNWLLARVVAYSDAYDWQENRYSYDWRKKCKQCIAMVVHTLDRYTRHVVTPPLIRPEQLPDLISVFDNAYDPTKRVNMARWVEEQQKVAFTQYIKDYFSVEDDKKEEVTPAEEVPHLASGGGSSGEEALRMEL